MQIICENCKYFKLSRPEHRFGECRRRSPIPQYAVYDELPNQPYAEWPLIDKTDWCGEFEPKQTMSIEINCEKYTKEKQK